MMKNDFSQKTSEEWRKSAQIPEGWGDLVTLRREDYIAMVEVLAKKSLAIERVRAAMLKMESAAEEAYSDWRSKADMFSQGASDGYLMSAQWVEEATEEEEHHDH